MSNTINSSPKFGSNSQYPNDGTQAAKAGNDNNGETNKGSAVQQPPQKKEESRLGGGLAKKALDFVSSPDKSNEGAGVWGPGSEKARQIAHAGMFVGGMVPVVGGGVTLVDATLYFSEDQLTKGVSTGATALAGFFGAGAPAKAAEKAVEKTVEKTAEKALEKTAANFVSKQAL